MKIKKLLAVLIAVVLVTSSVLSVSAATLSDVTPENSTEVKANIVDPGSVYYVITIPATADFGTLTQPENTENDNYTFYNFQVEATELSILSGTAVSVWLKDGSSSDGKFYISQKDVASPFTMSYDVYDDVVNEGNVASLNPINLPGTQGAYGYQLVNFAANQQGAVQNVTLALNQNALYGQTLSDIAGDYSGTISFHSALIVVG